jgi:DNA-binding CsgD family transcriptional regulator
MTATQRTDTRIRVAIVAPAAAERQTLRSALRDAPDLDVLAWADAIEPLLVLGTRADVVLSAVPPSEDDAARLRELGIRLVVAADGDPLAALRAAHDAEPDDDPRPRLSRRQRDVLVAYVASSDLLPTVARQLGMDPETVKTHLRRIRAKYADVGRPAPTRRDLYVRAVEDGVLPPPSGTMRR